MEADALIYKPQKPKLVLQAFIMLGGLLLSLWMMNNAMLVMHRELRLTVFFAAFFGCVVFGYTFLYNALRVWSSEPVLKADAEEVLADATSQMVKASLADDLTVLDPTLQAQWDAVAAAS